MSEDFRARYGPWALVAGASEGLGEAFAAGIAARGVNVAMVARRADTLERTAARVAEAHGVETRALCADLSDPRAPARLLDAVAELDLGLFVYNAALSVPGPYLDVDAGVHLAAIQTNCASPAALAHGLGRRLRDRGRGGILLVSSLSALYGTGYLATYAATKAFGLTLAEGLWAELSDAGVDVLATCAGSTLTPGYAARAPARLPRLAPAPMDPAAVAEDALHQLGRRGPRVIPGRANRVASFLLRAFVPRRRAIRIMTEAGRAVAEAEGRREGDG